MVIGTSQGSLFFYLFGKYSTTVEILLYLIILVFAVYMSRKYPSKKCKECGRVIEEIDEVIN